jgi:hypothetical protein
MVSLDEVLHDWLDVIRLIRRRRGRRKTDQITQRDERGKRRKTEREKIRNRDEGERQDRDEEREGNLDLA